MHHYISPASLLELVRNTAPFLSLNSAQHCRPVELGDQPNGYRDVLSAVDRVDGVVDYFAFCMAAHHATVATFVPTDVDTKIRGLLWRDTRDRDSLRSMFDFALRSARWSIDGVSRRATEVTDAGPVSGHNGEWLSVAAGALGAFIRISDLEYAARAEDAIDSELRRECIAFRHAIETSGLELDALRLAATLTHNAGDLDQGISFWPKTPRHRAMRECLGRLAHENRTPYDGTFQAAARIYRTALAAEGHRHYPLRTPRSLRRSPDFLLPLGPFFDDWGFTIGSHPDLSDGERAEVLAALVTGCRKIPGQRGYYRAIAGMLSALGGRIEDLVRRLPSTARSEWKNSELRKHIAVPRVSFESMMKKMLAAAR